MAAVREWPNGKQWMYAISIGFFAGLIWGAVKVAEYALRFTEIVPGFLLEPFYWHSYLETRWGCALGLVSFVAFSIVASLLYMLLFRQVAGPWMGLVYGMLWWCVLYVLCAPLLELPVRFWQMNANSFVTDICLFVLWGLFIGYSIAMEFNDERHREPANGP